MLPTALDSAGHRVQMVWGGMKAVGIGCVLGLVAAFLVSRILQGLPCGVGTLDPVAFLGVPSMFLIISLLAAYGPARRASRVDPVRALRVE